MAFTGKTTFGAGADLPELIEDVSDIIGTSARTRRRCWITWAIRATRHKAPCMSGSRTRCWPTPARSTRLSLSPIRDRDRHHRG